MNPEYKPEIKIDTPDLNLEDISNTSKLLDRKNDRVDVRENLAPPKVTNLATLDLNLKLEDAGKMLSKVDWLQINSKEDVCNLLRSKIKQLASLLRADGFDIKFDEKAFKTLDLFDLKGFDKFMNGVLIYLSKCVKGEEQLGENEFNFKEGVVKVQYRGSLDKLVDVRERVLQYYAAFSMTFKNIVKVGERWVVDQTLSYNSYYDGVDIIKDADIKRLFSRHSKEEYREKFHYNVNYSWSEHEKALWRAVGKIRAVLNNFKNKDKDVVIKYADAEGKLNEAVEELFIPYLCLKASVLRAKNPNKRLKFYHVYPGDDITNEDNIAMIDFLPISLRMSERLVKAAEELLMSCLELKRYMENDDRMFYADLYRNWRVVPDDADLKPLDIFSAKDVFSEMDGEALLKLVTNIFDMADCAQHEAIN